jgi:hypothetical protein
MCDMAVTIVVGTNSWVTEAEANAYFEARVKAGEYWVNNAADNKPALVTAYKWLMSGKYSLAASISAEQPIKDAQCEMALFLLQHQPDLDLRMGLQAQGVIAAGVVKERYKDDNTVEMPIPPVLQQLLQGYDTDRAVYLVNLERNEAEGVAYDTYANLGNDEP